MTRTPIIISGSLAALVAVAGVGYVVGIDNAVRQETSSQSVESSPSPSALESTDAAAPDATAPTTTVDTATAELLTYLVEEEKLAHDVYTALGDQWGDRVFSNISRSESRHQDQVAGLLEVYGITDPRSTEAGVFVNEELQKLFDSLIAQGSTSRTSAMEVGVLIEQTDIADLTDAMAASDDALIDSTLAKLLDASHNHLNAFSRQL